MLDELDRKILKSLLKDSRSKMKDLARECDVSVPTIRARYDRMKREKIILDSTLFADPKDFGYEQVFSVFLDVKNDQVNEFLTAIQNGLELFSIHVDSTKEYNVHMELYLRNIEEFQKINQKIRQHNAVSKMKIARWLETMVFPENVLIDK